ncbi:MAG: glycosyltransferase [Rhodocyclaceae bacterium]|nr:glycosyltransferase [Rhodocyclaceae bacterium]
MTVVFFSYAYPPLKYPRAIQVGRLGKFLSAPPRVLCCDDASAKDASLEAVASPDADRRVFADRAGKLAWVWRKLTNLPDRQRPWAMRTAREAVATGLVGREDVLVTFGQPMSDHLAGLRIKRATGCPWVAHFSDPWTDNPFHWEVPLQRTLLRRMEASVVQAADRLVFTSEETVELVMAKYPAALRAKASALPHAFDPGLYGEAEPADGRKVVRYVGAFYRQRNPLALMEAIRALRARAPRLLEGVRFELVGPWNGNAGWTPQDAGLPADLATTRKPVPYLESLRLMRSADLLLILDAPFEQSVFFPSKLVDYIGAGRPVLAFTPPGTSARVLAEVGGRAYPAGDAEVMARGLAETLEDLAAGRLAAPSAEAARGYAGPAVAARFEALLAGLGS